MFVKFGSVCLSYELASYSGCFSSEALGQKRLRPVNC